MAAPERAALLWLEAAASSLSSVIYNNLRSLIIGKMYTSADLAYYNQGDNLTYNIASSVDTSIESVLFPVMSSLQDDRAQVKNMTRRSIKTCTYIIAPVMMSTAFCAEPLVRLILTRSGCPVCCSSGCSVWGMCAGRSSRQT